MRSYWTGGRSRKRRCFSSHRIRAFKFLEWLHNCLLTDRSIRSQKVEATQPTILPWSPSSPSSPSSPWGCVASTLEGQGFPINQLSLCSNEENLNARILNKLKHLLFRLPQLDQYERMFIVSYPPIERPCCIERVKPHAWFG